MHAAPAAILDHLASLADATRSRLLLLLDRHELTVSELCGVMQLPQSTVSRHLKALADSGWVASRADGTSHLYTLARDALDPAARRLWLLVREQVGSTTAATARPAAAAGRARRAAADIAGVLLFVCRPVGSPARGTVRRAPSPLRVRGFRRARLGRRRSGLRHRPGERRARAVCRSASSAIDASAAMLQSAKKRPAGLRQHRPAARRARGAADRRCANSTRR